MTVECTAAVDFIQTSFRLYEHQVEGQGRTSIRAVGLYPDGQLQSVYVKPWSFDVSGVDCPGDINIQLEKVMADVSTQPVISLKTVLLELHKLPAYYSSSKEGLTLVVDKASLSRFLDWCRSSGVCTAFNCQKCGGQVFRRQWLRSVCGPYEEVLPKSLINWPGRYDLNKLAETQLREIEEVDDGDRSALFCIFKELMQFEDRSVGANASFRSTKVGDCYEEFLSKIGMI